MQKLLFFNLATIASSRTCCTANSHLDEGQSTPFLKLYGTKRDSSNFNRERAEHAVSTASTPNSRRKSPSFFYQPCNAYFAPGGLCNDK
jgi:hypothetical protein